MPRKVPIRAVPGGYIVERATGKVISYLGYARETVLKKERLNRIRRIR
jgi:hypothetical protein